MYQTVTIKIEGESNEKNIHCFMQEYMNGFREEVPGTIHIKLHLA